MNSLLLRAALVAVSAPAALAGNGAENDWLALDSQLGGLGSPTQYQGTGVNVGAMIRAHYRQSDDFTNDDGEEFGGFVLDDARIFAAGNYGEFDWRLSMDFAEGAGGYPIQSGPNTTGDPGGGGGSSTFSGQTFEAELLDAYARWEFSDAFGIQIGQFNARDAFSGDVGSDRLLFTTRSFVGVLFNEYDVGVQLDGSYGDQDNPDYQWSISATNGNDGAEGDLDVHARLDFNYLGDEALWAEGAYGTSNAGGSMGFFWAEDGDVDADGGNGTIYGVDYRAAYGPFFLGAEYVDFDSKAAADAGLGAGKAEVWSTSLSYLFGDDMNWEMGVRYEDLDSDTDESRVTAGLAYYLSGHNIKWQFSWVDIDSDDPDDSGEVFQLGLSMGLSAKAL